MCLAYRGFLPSPIVRGKGGKKSLAINTDIFLIRVKTK